MCAGDPAGQTRREGQGTKQKEETWALGHSCVLSTHLTWGFLQERALTDPLFKMHLSFSGSDVRDPPAMRETLV